MNFLDMKKNAAAYARVSGGKQSETSIETQLEDIEKFAKVNKIEILETFKEKITASGERERPAFNRMIEKAKKGEFSMILVWSQSRFYRDNVAEQVLLRELEEVGVLVVSVTEPFDVTTLHGKLARWMMSGFNWLFIATQKKEVVAKTTKAAERAYFLGGIPPYGLKTKQIRDPEASRNRRVYEIDESEAPAVRVMFNMYAAGYGYGEIAKVLNESDFEPTNKKSWSKATIRDMLQNERYMGTYVYRKGTKHNSHAKRTDTIRVPNAIPAIVSEEIFRKVQEIFKKRGHNKVSEKKSNFGLISGIVYCGDCGAKMYFRTTTKTAGQYLCSRWINHRDVKCVQLSQQKVEEQVLGYLRNEVLSEEINFDEMAEEYNQQQRALDELLHEKLESIANEERECRMAMDNAVEAILNGSPVAKQLEIVAGEKKYRLKELQNIRKQLLEKGRNQITKEIIEEKYRGYRAKLDESREAQRQLILTMVEKVVIFEDGYVRLIMK